MEFLLLGPVEVRNAGGLVDAGPPQQRSVLAALAVDAGRPVLLETLVDRVWGATPPEGARRTLYVYVSRIRQMLDAAGGEPASLVRRSGGYQLEVGVDQIDAHRFRALVDRARHPGLADADQADLTGQALGLWQGTPLGNLTGQWADRVREAWHLQRIEAATQWAGAQLRLGRSQAAIGPLSTLAGDYPLVEALVGALMQALSAVGRGAEALDRYALLRQRLADELGADPGGELQVIHQSILRGDGAKRPHGRRKPGPPEGEHPHGVIPAQLPLGTAGFAGRGAQLAELDLAAAGALAGTAVGLTVVSGMAGVGKTALAVHWARRIADRFPDGQLYLNLRGFDPGATMLDPIVAMHTFLDALGVAPQRIPATPEAQAGLYRSLLADRRMLIVLDNARHADQVRPLLPGSAGCMVVVTSRNEMVGLVAVESAYPITLDLPSTVDAREMLTRRLDRHRAAAEPQAVGEIIRRCARLPLALAIVAARAAARPGFPLSALADELGTTGTGLDTWSNEDIAVDVRAVFSWSIQVLDPAAARLFRLLGLHPGPDFTAAAAASLAGLPTERARSLLAELARGHLLLEHVPTRYAFHDLLRTYAIELTQACDTDPERTNATHRLLGHYLHTAFAAAKLLNPHREPVAVPLPHDGVLHEDLADYHQASTWLSAEHRVVLAILELAIDSGLDAYAEPLAWSLTDFLQRKGLWQDQAAIHTAALAATQRLDDRHGRARAHRHLSRAYILLGRLDEAHEQYGHALDLAEQIGDTAGQAHVHLNVANLLERQDRYVEALDHAKLALNLFMTVESKSNQGRARNMVGWFHARLGHYAAALIQCRQALTQLEEVDDRHGQVFAWDSLGYTHHLGEHDQAIDCYEHALNLARDYGDRIQQAEALTHLGDTHQSAGDPDLARAAWQHAVDILNELDHPDAGQVRAKIQMLPVARARAGRLRIVHPRSA